VRLSIPPSHQGLVRSLSGRQGGESSDSSGVGVAQSDRRGESSGETRNGDGRRSKSARSRWRSHYCERTAEGSAPHRWSAKGEPREKHRTGSGDRKLKRQISHDGNEIRSTDRSSRLKLTSVLQWCSFPTLQKDVLPVFFDVVRSSPCCGPSGCPPLHRTQPESVERRCGTDERSDPRRPNQGRSCSQRSRGMQRFHLLWTVLSVATAATLSACPQIKNRSMPHPGEIDGHEHPFSTRCRGRGSEITTDGRSNDVP
jgi:hypothetical protein